MSFNSGEKSLMRILLVCILLGLPGLSRAQVISGAGTTSGAFLQIPVGARSMALGSAVTGAGADASTMYWNPGALAILGQRELMVEHSPWFAGTHHNYLGIVLPISPTFGTVGVSVVYFGMDDMEETTFDEQDGTGRFFSAYSYAAGISYARYLHSTFSIGGTLKYVNEHIWNTSAGGTVALDLGTHYVTPYEDLTFGVRIANFGPKMRMLGSDLITTVDIDPINQGNNPRVNTLLETKQFNLPLLLQAGIAWKAWRSEIVNATFMMDANVPSNERQNVNLGAELAFFNELFAFQAGLPNLGLGDDRMMQFAAGANVQYALDGGVGFNAGYGMVSHRWLGIVNRISLQIRF